MITLIQFPGRQLFIQMCCYVWESRDEWKMCRIIRDPFIHFSKSAMKMTSGVLGERCCRMPDSENRKVLQTDDRVLQEDFLSENSTNRTRRGQTLIIFKAAAESMNISLWKRKFNKEIVPWKMKITSSFTRLSSLMKTIHSTNNNMN